LENRRRELIEREKDLVNRYEAEKSNLNISTWSKKLSFCETNVTVYQQVSANGLLILSSYFPR